MHSLLLLPLYILIVHKCNTLGLQVFEFEYDFTNPRLIAWEARVLQLAGIWTQIEPKAAPRDKRKDTNFTEMLGLKTYMYMYELLTICMVTLT